MAYHQGQGGVLPVYVALREGRRVMPAEGAEAAQSSAPARGRPAMCIARGGAHVLGESRGATTSHTFGPWRLMWWASQNVARACRLLHHLHLPPAPLSSPHSRWRRVGVRGESVAMARVSGVNSGEAQVLPNHPCQARVGGAPRVRGRARHGKAGTA